jgi:hypothetical protein
VQGLGVPPTVPFRRTYVDRELEARDAVGVADGLLDLTTLVLGERLTR